MIQHLAITAMIRITTTHWECLRQIWHHFDRVFISADFQQRVVQFAGHSWHSFLHLNHLYHNYIELLQKAGSLISWLFSIVKPLKLVEKSVLVAQTSVDYQASLTNSKPYTLLQLHP